MTAPHDPTQRWIPPPYPPRRPPPPGYPPPQHRPYPPPRAYRPPPPPRYYPPPYYPPRYGAPPPYPSPVAPQPKSGRTVLLTLSLLVAVAAAGVLIAVGVSRLDLVGGRQLDVRKTEAAVRQILTNPSYGYGVENVGDVRCNDGKNPSVKAGRSFNCVVVVGGAKRRVAVLITDDNGTYEVDRPR